MLTHLCTISSFEKMACTKPEITENGKKDNCTIPPAIEPRPETICFLYMRKQAPLFSLHRLYNSLTFYASSHLLWLYSLVFVGRGRKPRNILKSFLSIVSYCYARKALNTFALIKCDINQGTDRIMNIRNKLQCCLTLTRRLNGLHSTCTALKLINM